MLKQYLELGKRMGIQPDFIIQVLSDAYTNKNPKWAVAAVIMIIW
jgi:hypothetical protein